LLARNICQNLEKVSIEKKGVEEPLKGLGFRVPK
jgi:hypothetical protein